MLGLVALFAEAAHHAAKAEHAAVAKAAEIIEAGAKHAIGSYEFGWPPLAESTVARKANGDTPLLETGALRDSISHEVHEHSAVVGSTSDIARYHEFGTSRIPPRPFLWGSAMHHAEEIEKQAGDVVIKTLGLS